MKEKEKTDDSKEDIIYCKECNYRCKKELSLKKHMVTKHENVFVFKGNPGKVKV